MVSPLFSAILEKNRARYNARFADARHFLPLLEPDAFAEHLAGVVDPIIQAVARAAPGREEPAADELFDLSLELVGREILGPRSRFPAVPEGWARLLPLLAGHVAENPTRTAGAVTNAIHTLSKEPSARPFEWIERMEQAAPHCPNFDAFLRAGQAAAWRSGMAHYRRGALEILSRLPAGAAGAALGLPVGTDGQVAQTLDRLERDPWFNPCAPGRAARGAARLDIAARAGGFRGYNGAFLTPPVVIGREGDAFIVRENASTWRLFADCFGAALLRAEPSLAVEAAGPSSQFTYEPGGQVRTAGRNRVFRELRDATGWASNGSTLAVTTRFSHWVFLVAEVETEENPDGER